QPAQPQEEPPRFLLRIIERIQKNNAAATTKSTMISVISIFLLHISDSIHVSPVNDACLFQGLYHPVHGCNSNRLVLFPDLIIDLVTTGTVIFQYGADNQSSLFRNPEPPLL